MTKPRNSIELMEYDDGGWKPGEFFMYLGEEEYKKIKAIAKEIGWE